MEITEIILQGGGGHARVVIDCLKACSFSVKALFDPKYSGELMGVPQCGVYDPTAVPGALAIVAIGNNEVRRRVAIATKHRFAKVIHPSAIVSPFASVGEGSMILQGSIVQAHTKIGSHVILNTGAQVDHDGLIGDFVHIAPRAVLCGTVEVGDGALIGAGAIVLPGRKIGRWSVVGAGAVVTHDVPDGETFIGNPAQKMNLKRG